MVVITFFEQPILLLTGVFFDAKVFFFIRVIFFFASLSMSIAVTVFLVTLVHCVKLVILVAGFNVSMKFLDSTKVNVRLVEFFAENIEFRDLVTCFISVYLNSNFLVVTNFGVETNFDVKVYF